jgi:hypothetical protein
VFRSSTGSSRKEVADVRSTGFSRNPGEKLPKGGTTNSTFLAVHGIARFDVIAARCLTRSRRAGIVGIVIDPTCEDRIGCPTKDFGIGQEQLVGRTLVRQGGLKSALRRNWEVISGQFLIVQKTPLSPSERKNQP